MLLVGGHALHFALFLLAILNELENIMRRPGRLLPCFEKYGVKENRELLCILKLCVVIYEASQMNWVASERDNVCQTYTRPSALRINIVYITINIIFG